MRFFNIHGIIKRRFELVRVFYADECLHVAIYKWSLKGGIGYDKSVVQIDVNLLV